MFVEAEHAFMLHLQAASSRKHPKLITDAKALPVRMEYRGLCMCDRVRFTRDAYLPTEFFFTQLLPPHLLSSAGAPPLVAEHVDPRSGSNACVTAEELCRKQRGGRCNSVGGQSDAYLLSPHGRFSHCGGKLRHALEVLHFDSCPTLTLSASNAFRRS